MSNVIRIRLRFLFCVILAAASGVLLHAAPIKKLPDEPEESAPAVKKLPDAEDASASAENGTIPAEKEPAKTEAEAIRVITDRLDKTLYPYKPLQRGREPILNRDLSDEVILRDSADNKCTVLDESHSTMLEFAARISLRMDIGDLF